MYPDYPEGAPCWADARLPDVEAGKRFYGDLFGWTFDEGAGAERGFYTGAYGEDRAVAALAPGARGWTVHFAVRDAYTAAERVAAAGGHLVSGPVSDGAVATVALAAGPDGAVFGLWQAGSHQGFERTGAPGALCRAELRTPDAVLSDTFYTDVFGYPAPHLGDGNTSDLHIWRMGSPAGAGPGAPEVGRRAVSGWNARFLLHFGTADLAATCAEAVRLGGHVRVAPHSTPYGPAAVLVDDQGAVFAVCAA
ncbi:VOC family protein [Streptomyces kunmingensis]|uniref:VOC family protein n=1 Tax=Streptomyces kunmingensis TaxID=68225 RepID=A0ABU6CHS6_9ACTN|nr:VOC family protein [Streptomyces kunmingensis]MEB3964271.1 VOC family protein [Streptomyces kunmingensis]